MSRELWTPPVVAAIEAATSRHLGRSWRVCSWTDLGERSSHPAMIFRGDVRRGSGAVFAKLTTTGAASGQVRSELAGLRLIAAVGVPAPVPVGNGRIELPDGSAVLLLEALDEHPDRSTEDWRDLGRVLAALHGVRAKSYGAPADGFFGPLPLENAPVGSNRWADFYAERRVLPYLRAARDAGAVDSSTTAAVEALLRRLPGLAGSDPGPRLLHGDAQHHNFLSTEAGAYVIDASPYFGHPELDLALLDYFSPVPPVTWAAYEEIRPIDAGFDSRRELWRIFAYLAILSVDAVTEFGRSFHGRLQHALARYR